MMLNDHQYTHIIYQMKALTFLFDAHLVVDEKYWLYTIFKHFCKTTPKYPYSSGD